jgi:hypothetical protein
MLLYLIHKRKFNSHRGIKKNDPISHKRIVNRKKKLHLHNRKSKKIDTSREKFNSYLKSVRNISKKKILNRKSKMRDFSKNKHKFSRIN